MAKSLVIVESKAKAKTIGKYLGKNYSVKACLGHIRDLPKWSFGVDVKSDFKPSYQINRERKEIVKEIKEAAKKSDEVLIATDPDREGEAIAWHIAHILKSKNVKRIEFNEITRKAVKEAIKHPREIDILRVNAQQARRILDRIVGYNLSPFLWREIQSGLSAGRVQSVALKLICDREDLIEAFVPQEYWTITAEFKKQGDDRIFQLLLARENGEKSEIPSGDECAKRLKELEGADYIVSGIQRKEIKKRPPPPFITSSLQIEGAKRLRFPARRTMQVAQQLYEGLDVGGRDPVGLITYMRTDSYRIADEAISQVREYIKETCGADYLPPTKNVFKMKKRVQDAHEAIRPTDVNLKPDDVKEYLNNDQFKMYQIVWQRFVASQMMPGVDDQRSVEVGAGRFTFRGSLTTVRFDGFRRIYQESKENGNNAKYLPELSQDEKVLLEKLVDEQHFTKPPPRFNTASLVKTLEDLGVGRPSTYAPTIATIQDKRKYVVRENSSFRPSDLGRQVNKLMVAKFSDIINEGFTAEIEENLDQIQDGSKEWVETIREFYEPFKDSFQRALGVKCPTCGSDIEIKSGRFGAFFACSAYPECTFRESIVKGEEEETDEECPECQKKLVLKNGRYGRFFACTGFPDCKYTRSKPKEGESQEQREIEYGPEPCPECSARTVLRRSKMGRFYGCEKYPDCKGTIPYKIGMKCPREGCEGDVIERRSRSRKLFYACTKYPDCEYTSFVNPLYKKEDKDKQSGGEEQKEKGAE